MFVVFGHIHGSIIAQAIPAVRILCMAFKDNIAGLRGCDVGNQQACGCGNQHPAFFGNVYLTYSLCNIFGIFQDIVLVQETYFFLMRLFYTVKSAVKRCHPYTAQAVFLDIENRIVAQRVAVICFVLKTLNVESAVSVLF